MSQLKTQLGDNKINNIVFSGHVNDKNPGILFGDDYVRASNAEGFGKELAPFMDSKELSILLISCHSGAGDNNNGVKFSQTLSNSSGADVYSSKTWGKAYSGLFNNNNIWSISPDYANFSKVPGSVDRETQLRKPSAIKYLGQWTLATPYAKKVETVTKLFVRHNGNFTFTK